MRRYFNPGDTQSHISPMRDARSTTSEPKSALKMNLSRCSGAMFCVAMRNKAHWRSLWSAFISSLADMSAGRDSTLTISKSCAESERKSKDNIKVKTTFFIEYRNSITNAAKITDFALWVVTKCYFMKKVRVAVLPSLLIVSHSDLESEYLVQLLRQVVSFLFEVFTHGLFQYIHGHVVTVINNGTHFHVAVVEVTVHLHRNNHTA